MNQSEAREWNEPLQVRAALQKTPLAIYLNEKMQLQSNQSHYVFCIERKLHNFISKAAFVIKQVVFYLKFSLK